MGASMFQAVAAQAPVAAAAAAELAWEIYMGVYEHRGPLKWTLKEYDSLMKGPKKVPPKFRKPPHCAPSCDCMGSRRLCRDNYQ